jgi:hypothetical protein
MDHSGEGLAHDLHYAMHRLHHEVAVYLNIQEGTK